MYAVIETGGKQYRVQEGDIITVEKLGLEAGSVVAFDKVLVLSDGNEVKIGKPYVGTSVTGTVVENGKGEKVVIYKYKAKKDYRKKQGHRQPFTAVKIESLTGEAPKAAPAEVVAEESPKKVSASMKKDELIAFAKENNIEIDEKATKAVIIEAIEAALN